MTIEYYNLKQQYLDQREELLTAIDQVAQGGQYFADRSVTKFESLISKLYNGASAVACNSGTSALTIALRAANLPLNSYVAIPAMTYIATANAVLAAGLKPVIVDIDDYWLMNYTHLEQYFDTEYNISAVVVVDLYGQGVCLDKFKKLCDQRGVKLIVDAAQSFDLGYYFYHQIDHCDSLALSFNPLKNLGAMGNAGAVVSKNYKMEDLTKWCVQNKVNNDVTTSGGNNSRIDALQAAILNVKYKLFENNMIRKGAISYHYKKMLESVVEMPEKNAACTHKFYAFVIAPKNASKVQQALTKANIEYSGHYRRPLNHYSIFQNFKDYCPKASSLEGRCISLPNHWHLADDEVEKIVYTVKRSL